MRKLASWVLLLSFGLLLGGCAPRVQLLRNGPPPAALPIDSQVLVLKAGSYVPPGYDNLGTLRIGEAGATIGCSLPTIIELARQRARQAGANVVAISTITPPSAMSTCYQLEAELLYAPNLADFARKQAGAYHTPLPVGAADALRHAYRPPGEPQRSFELCLSDSVLARLPATSYYRLRVPATGRLRN